MTEAQQVYRPGLDAFTNLAYHTAEGAAQCEKEKGRQLHRMTF